MIKNKVLITVSNDMSYDQRMHKTATTLCELGYEVYILCFETSQSKETPKSDKYKIIRLKSFIDKTALFYFFINIRIFIYLLINKYDIVLSVDLDTLGACSLAKRFINYKLIYDSHELFTEVPELNEKNFIKAIWQKIEFFSIRNTNKRYTVSNSISEYYKKLYNLNFDVIYNYPYQNRNHMSKHNIKEIKIILYTGSLNEGRGLEVAIESMKYINNAELWIAGNGLIKSELVNLTNKLKLSKKVKFLGQLKYEELTELYSISFVGLNLLSNNSLSYYYSLANKFFDYTQYSLICINMNFPEYAKINQEYDCSLLLNKLDPIELSKSINLLIENTELYTKLKKNTDIAKQNYYWQNQIQKLSSIFNN